MLAMVTAAQNKSDISSQSQAILLLRMKMTWTILLSLRMKMATFLQKRTVTVYSVHVRTRKFRNFEKTKRYVVPAPKANAKTQGGTKIDSDSICHRHHSVFSGFLTV
jgi:hypothetical protein